MPDNGADKYFIGGGEHGFIGKAKACYIIVFEGEPQLMEFYDMLKVMKKLRPDVSTHGGRVTAFVKEFLEHNKDTLAQVKSKKSKKKETQDVDSV
jgi:hypothetical protein